MEKYQELYLAEEHQHHEDQLQLVVLVGHLN